VTHHRQIALIDHTKKHPPAPGVLEAMAEALTTQVERDFAPVWGIAPVKVTVGGRGEKIHFFDSAHEAGDLGYHNLDPRGRPYAHVYAAPAMTHGSDWTSGTDAISATASHEVLEMLVDPTAMDFSFNGGRTLWAREVSDPVQEDLYSIRARGSTVAVSDFVLPAFFNPFSTGPFDHLRVLKTSFSLAKGGYAVCERRRPDFEKDGRRFGVTFDKKVPKWRREQKLSGFGRTYWRLLLHE
jgi:hypothetical protein